MRVGMLLTKWYPMGWCCRCFSNSLHFRFNELSTDSFLISPDSSWKALRECAWKCVRISM